MQRMRAELRRARLQFKKGQLSAADYEKVINEYMQYAIREQERIGLDVLVHGEPERTDMCVTLPAPRVWPPSWFSMLSCIRLLHMSLLRVLVTQLTEDVGVSMVREKPCQRQALQRSLRGCRCTVHCPPLLLRRAALGQPNPLGLLTCGQ